MPRVVLPRATPRAVWLLTGRTYSVPCSAMRAPQLDDDTIDHARDVDALSHSTHLHQTAIRHDWPPSACDGPRPAARDVRLST